LEGKLIQKLLDDLVARNPDMEKYLTNLDYIPQGEEPAPEHTHTVKLANIASGEDLVIALTAQPPYGAIADLLLERL
jgi:hypothetical protein